ncbi:MAG: FecR domain-containing protein, partial [Pseudomonadota bacterium]
MTQTFAIKSQRILREARHWIFVLEAASPDDNVQAEFEAWLDIDPDHAALFEHVKKTSAGLRALKPYDIQQPLRYSLFDSVQIYLSDILAAIMSRKAVAAGMASAVTACFALGLVLLPMQTSSVQPTQPKTAAYASQIGEIKSVKLSDGSAVTLGARSSIETQFFSDKRIVVLSAGTAHFEVAKDAKRPFTVKAGDLEATALGTAFDVQIRGRAFTVAVAEGRVNVAYPFIVNGARMGMRTMRDLSIGQQVTATRDRGLEDVAEVNVKSMAAWRSGQLIYAGVSLADLVTDLNRYSPTPIEIDAQAKGLAGYR